MPGSATSADKHRVLLVTGLLGAGKSTALNILEDLGWETIDNFPIRLLDRLIDNPDAAGSDLRPPLAIGFDTRTRGFNPHKVIDRVKKLSTRADLELTTLFLDCSGAELERRYNETRRPHPLADSLPVAAGIAAERELLEPLRRWADAVITTTSFSPNDLQQALRELFLPLAERNMTITVTSFGFARGMPPIADLVFDMRFLDNPHWVDGLRELTGQDAQVAAHIKADPTFAPSWEKMRDLILHLLPLYKAQGKAYVNIGIGCTGGRHRSVFTAELLGQTLRNAGYQPTLVHRNLGSRAADTVEGQPKEQRAG